MSSSLDCFHTFTKQWFLNTLGTPTAVQEEAWPAIASGQDTLVSAPTGTGKTLSAFLVFIDRMKEQARKGTLPQELQLIYVSPLKSLAGDIRENLRRPLDGIYREESLATLGRRDTPFDIQVAIRTGDTTQQERKSMVKTPPHILITTPESLYLLLTLRLHLILIIRWMVYQMTSHIICPVQQWKPASVSYGAACVSEAHILRNCFQNAT